MMKSGQYELGSGKALGEWRKSAFRRSCKPRGKEGGDWAETGKVRKVETFTFRWAFRPDVELIKLRSFTLWQGLKIAMLLHSLTGIEGISVKWPNDLVYDKKKIGGMLTEASIDCQSAYDPLFSGLDLTSIVRNPGFQHPWRKPQPL